MVRCVPHFTDYNTHLLSVLKRLKFSQSVIRESVSSANVTRDVIVRAQEKGWMTKELMLEWVKLVWNRRPEFSQNFLSLDAFKGHLTDAVKNSLRKTDCELGSRYT